MIWIALALVMQQPAAPQDPVRVQMGVTVRPDTVTVGDPYLVMVRVRAPAGTRIVFPAAPDTGGTVEGVDPLVERAADEPNAEDRTAIYRVSAWDTGQVAFELGAVELTGAVERTLPIQDPTVYVRSVLPADTALQTPKPARDIFAAERSWWWLLLIALVALALVGLLLWWWWRRRRRPKPVLVEDPFARAEREFAALAEMGLPEAGEPGRHVALATEVLRDYLAGRLPDASTALTTGELLRALEVRRELPLDAMRNLLFEADLVKFARRPVTPERARTFAEEAHGVVKRVEHVEQARRAADLAAATPRKAS
jgi:hypothetical protein